MYYIISYECPCGCTWENADLTLSEDFCPECETSISPSDYEERGN